MKPDHPVFYGYDEQDLPGEVRAGLADVPRRRSPIRATCSRGTSAATPRAERTDARRRRDSRPRRSRSTCRGGYNGKGRVIMFANNPIYRWQNHGEFNMVFNSMHELERRAGRQRGPVVAAANRRGRSRSEMKHAITFGILAVLCAEPGSGASAQQPPSATTAPAAGRGLDTPPRKSPYGWKAPQAPLELTRPTSPR